MMGVVQLGEVEIFGVWTEGISTWDSLLPSGTKRGGTRAKSVGAGVATSPEPLGVMKLRLSVGGAVLVGRALDFTTGLNTGPPFSEKESCLREHTEEDGGSLTDSSRHYRIQDIKTKIFVKVWMNNEFELT